MLAGYLILLLGPIAGMRCTRINENAGQSSGKWTTTYLCVPQDSPYLIEFSNNGPIAHPVVDVLVWAVETTQLSGKTITYVLNAEHANEVS